MTVSVSNRVAYTMALGGLFLVTTLPATAQPERTKVTPSPPVLLRTLERRAVVESLPESVQNLKITNLEGRDISDDVQPRIDQGRVTMNFRTWEPVAVKPREVGTIVLNANQRITLPGGVIVPLLPAPDVSGPVKPAWFHLTLAASPMPAAWDPASRSYLTRLTFGLKRPEGAPASLTLGQPVVIKVDYQGLTAPDTATIVLEAPGIENEKTISLPFVPSTAKPTLLVRSSISDVNLELAALPRLEVKPVRDTVLGLGLETISVAISRVSPDGRLSPVARDTPLALEVSGRARVEEETTSLKSGSADTRVTLRSAGLGEMIIRASADGVGGAGVVRQRFPVGPLIAALLGGMLGGLARRFVKGARRFLTGRRLAEGAVVATIAFVAGVLGVGYFNLPSAIVGTEAGAFLTGALAGFVGVSVVEALTRKLRPAEDAGV